MGGLGEVSIWRLESAVNDTNDLEHFQERCRIWNDYGKLDWHLRLVSTLLDQHNTTFRLHSFASNMICTLCRLKAFHIAVRVQMHKDADQRSDRADSRVPHYCNSRTLFPLKSFQTAMV